MNELMRQKLLVYGQWAYRGAWALEITAAFIGLAMGFAFFFKAYSESNSAFAVVPVAALVMVSLAELTKIPVATLLYAASWKWKPILFVFLGALAGITFLTVFQGISSSAKTREFKYNQLTEQINVFDREIKSISEAAGTASNSDRIEQAQQNLEKLEVAIERERTSLQKQIESVDKELESQETLSPEATRARIRLREAENRRTSRLDERDKEIKEANAQFVNQRDSYTQRLSNPDATPEQKELWAKELRALSNPRNTITKQHEKAISEIELEIKTLRDIFENLRGSGAGAAGPQRKQLEKQRTDLLLLLGKLDEKWFPQREKARQSISDAQAIEADKEQSAAGDQKRFEQIMKERNLVEAQRIPIAYDDQARQIAGMIFGKEPWEVTRREAEIINLSWSSSLAILAALAGPVMAMIALALQRIGSETNKTEAQNKFGRLLRNLMLRWRWRRVRTVKVFTPIEKEVEKIVEKIVEVQIEKVIKEILYVPILTDDPEAVKNALYEDLPAEVADIVKFSMKGAKGMKIASPA